MKKLLFVVGVFLTTFSGGGCLSGPDPYTWGDLSLDLGVAFCDASYRCGLRVSEHCAEHVQWHFCVDKNSCDVELPEGAQEAMALCEERLGKPQEQDCELLAWNIVPAECRAVFSYDPGPQ